MAFPAPHALQRPPKGRTLVLLATAAALFMLHGLSDHGTAHAGSDLSTASPTGELSAGHAGTSSVRLALSESFIAGELPDVVLPGHKRGVSAGWELAGLCMAVVGLTGLAMSGLRKISHPATRTATPAARSPQERLIRPRTADPPDLRQLQVHRC